MRDYDLLKAKDMFVQYVKWREEMRIDTILQVSISQPSNVSCLLDDEL